MANKLPMISNSHSSSNINDLSDDLLLEILFRLPHKWACRCKAVSKRWSFLVSNLPYFICGFIKRHLPLFQPKPGTSMPLVFVSQNEIAILHLPDIVKSFLQLAADFEKNLSLISFLGHPDSFKVVGCSNGLLLCKKFSRHYVVNPVTQEWIQLPLPPKRFVYTPVECFVCEPYFHFEPESETLTVNTHHRFRVLLVEERSSVELKAEIFTSETGQWNTTVVYLPQGYKLFLSDFSFPTIAHGGKLYFQARSNTFILVYDPFHGDSQFHVLHLPFHVDNQFQNNYGGMCWGTCCGKLRFSRFSYLYGKPLAPALLSVWELKEEEDPCWHLVHTAYLQWLEMEILVSQLGLRFSTGWRGFQVKAFHPYDGDVVYMQSGCRVFVFNLRDNEVKKTEIRQDMKEQKGSISGCFCIKILPIDFQWWPTPIPSLPR